MIFLIIWMIPSILLLNWFNSAIYLRRQVPTLLVALSNLILCLLLLVCSGYVYDLIYRGLMAFRIFHERYDGDGSYAGVFIWAFAMLAFVVVSTFYSTFIYSQSLDDQRI